MLVRLLPLKITGIIQNYITYKEAHTNFFMKLTDFSLLDIFSSRSLQ